VLRFKGQTWDIGRMEEKECYELQVASYGLRVKDSVNKRQRGMSKEESFVEGYVL